MDRALRFWFLALYAFGIIGFLSNVWRNRRGRPAFEQQIGPLPEVGAFVAWFVPPLIILSGIGQMAMEQPILRALGVGLSLYSQIMVLWTVRTLGRLLIPGLAVFRDHVLVTSGPFRWLRLALWPLLVAAIIKELPTEEAMLRAKFGAAYDAYATQTGRLIPSLWGWRKSPKSS